MLGKQLLGGVHFARLLRNLLRAIYYCELNPIGFNHTGHHGSIIWHAWLNSQGGSGDC